MATQQLIGLGYWRNLHQPEYPDVARFVDETWPTDNRAALLPYLQQGRPLHYWMGMETCLLGCGQHLPTTGLTDGTYYWPASLPHYVAYHAVRLPEVFVTHLRQQPIFPAAAAGIPEEIQPDFTWWQTQPGWHPAASSLPHLNPRAIREFLRRYDRQRRPLLSPTPVTQRALLNLVAELRLLV